MEMTTLIVIFGMRVLEIGESWKSEVVCYGTLMKYPIISLEQTLYFTLTTVEDSKKTSKEI